MRNIVGKNFGAKNAGKIHDLAMYLSLLKAGTDRDVTYSAIEIIKATKHNSQ